MVRSRTDGMAPWSQACNRSAREARSKRLTEEIDEWIGGGDTSQSVEEAKMVALVETADKSFKPAAMSGQDAENLASALNRALDEDEA